MTFFDSLEKGRENTVGIRNNRLAAIKSFMRCSVSKPELSEYSFVGTGVVYPVQVSG